MSNQSSKRAGQQAVRWGIAGPGRMAESFIGDFQHVTGSECVAVGSRSDERARAYASRHGLARAHGSYAELCADPEVDVVYVATPHPQHAEIALAAIENGKAVLVEKAFATNLAEATQVVEAARAAGVFCMEAMWTRFHPAVRELHRMVDAGELGPLRAVMGDLYAHREYDPVDRLFAPELGGGATLDLGVYVLSFAQDFLGTPDRVQAVGHLFPNGTDAQASIVLGHPGQTEATLAVGLQAAGPARMVVLGQDAWAELHGQFHHAERLTVNRRGSEPLTREFPLRGRGYSHMIEAVAQCVREGATECELVPLADTLAVQQQMDQVLAQLGTTPLGAAAGA